MEPEDRQISAHLILKQLERSTLPRQMSLQRAGRHVQIICSGHEFRPLRLHLLEIAPHATTDPHVPRWHDEFAVRCGKKFPERVLVSAHDSIKKGLIEPEGSERA